MDRSAPSEPCIRLDRVAKRFDSPAGSFDAVRPTDLEIAIGESVCIVGRSGSGKSTLLHLITGIDRPSAGRVELLGRDLGGLDESELARYRGASVGIVFQFFQLLPTLTVLENVVLAMDLVGRVERSRRRARALDLLDRVGVADHSRKFPAYLSGGEQQRVAIARALANDPPLVVADEPTGNLDSENARAIHDLFGQCVAEGRSLVVVTHDAAAAGRYSRCLEIHDGGVRESTVREAGDA